MKRRGIIVCAVSTPLQAKKISLAQQEKDGRKFFDKEDIDVMDVIKIDGYSRDFYTLREFVEYAVKEGNTDAARLEDYVMHGGFDVMWVRSTSRIAREQSINAEIINRSIKEHRAEIFSELHGWITLKNRRGLAAITGFTDSTEIDEFVSRTAFGVLERVKNGLPASGRVPFSHEEVMDKKGRKVVGIRPRADLYPLWRDLITLLLEDVAYDRLELELFSRFGHGKPDGKPYAREKFFHLLYNPVFWGNQIIRRSNEDAKPNTRGLWSFDPSVPAPPGVYIFYGTHKPVLTGRDAERVKAEIRRRSEKDNGTAQRYGHKIYTGLVYCDLCAWGYAYNVVRRGNRRGDSYLRCNHSSVHRLMPDRCPSKGVLPERVITAWLNERLEEWLAQGFVSIPNAAAEPVEEKPERQSRQQRAHLQKRLDRLVEELIAADDDLKEEYRSRIRATKDELAALDSHLLRDEAAELRANAVRKQQQITLEKIRAMKLPAFWAQPPLAIQTMLRSLLGDHRIYARNGKLVALYPAPQRLWRPRV